MAPNGIICYVPRGHCQQDAVAAASGRDVTAVINVGSPHDPITTAAVRGAGQEVMDLLKLEITFIVGWIYRQRGPPSLWLRKGQLQRIFLSVLAGPQNRD